MDLETQPIYSINQDLKQSHVYSMKLNESGGTNKHLEGEASMVTVEADSDAKRLIGRRFIDVSVQSDIRLWPLKIISGPNAKLMIVVNYNGEEKRFTAKKYPFKDPYADELERMMKKLEHVCTPILAEVYLAVCADMHIGQ
ncbi:hypothetical protein NC651_025403 [Populus alba x Populus x berolinensis]|nr:hypothetical protein NC651_025403 [Populus alba x Populus x berolinensis]